MTPQSISPRLTSEALALIKHFECLRLDAYTDPVGVPTIGYGHTHGVRLGTSITRDQAEEFLRLDLNDAQADVMRSVKVQLSDDEYGALVSFVFNIGGTAFARSRCLALLNKGDRQGAVEELQRFVKGRVHGRKVTLRGLQLRRAAERDLFCAIARDSGPALEAAQVAASPSPAAAAISGLDVLSKATADLPRVWLTRGRLATAAGVGTGIGAVPILDNTQGQSVWEQAGSLWQAWGAPSSWPGAQEWAKAWMTKFSQLAQSEAVRDLVSQVNAFLQSHTAVAAALGVTILYLTRRAFTRLLRVH